MMKATIADTATGRIHDSVLVATGTSHIEPVQPSRHSQKHSLLITFIDPPLPHWSRVQNIGSVVVVDTFTVFAACVVVLGLEGVVIDAVV